MYISIFFLLVIQAMNLQSQKSGCVNYAHFRKSGHIYIYIYIYI